MTSLTPPPLHLLQLQDPSKPPEIIFYHTMPMISIAAGGDGETYNLVCYVAKDETGRREAYIFDCEEHSDEVLATLGQSFVLAQDFAAQKKLKPDKEKLKKEYLDVEAVYDTASDVMAAAQVGPCRGIGQEHPNALNAKET